MNKLNIDTAKTQLVLRVALIFLLALAFWQPWRQTGQVRTITVSGNATMRSEPDYYQFSPQYQVELKDKTAAITQLNAKMRTITDKLQTLGVKDSDIALSAAAYQQYYPEKSDEETVTASLTVRVDTKDLAQKVQDYLVTTSPSGELTPIPSFSDERRQNLESDVRAKAIDDARAEAERTAKQLGERLGKVVEIKDTAGGGGIMPYETRVMSDDAAGAPSSLPIFPGEQEITFSVEVVYEIR